MRKEKLKVGIVGCGAIGSSLAKSIKTCFRGECRLAGIYDIDPEKQDCLSRLLNDRRLKSGSLKELIGRSELVIEATSASASWKIVRSAIMAGRSVMVMSVGGLVTYPATLRSLCRRKNASVFIPSGAVCGVDGLKASLGVPVESVTLTTTKPLSAFSGIKYLEKRKIDARKLKKDTLLFDGSAADAIRNFPQNINVAATLSIAGIGPEKTRVRIIASPKARRNSHKVSIESAAGSVETRTENTVHPDNPKTSYLAVLSGLACLRQILDPLKVGT